MIEVDENTSLTLWGSISPEQDIVVRNVTMQDTKIIVPKPPVS